MLLTTALGQCIRFPVEDVRVFKGRDSTGVRGISLAKGDRVISMTILNSFEATPEERVGFLKMQRAVIGDTATPRPAMPMPRRPRPTRRCFRRSAMPRWAPTSSSC